MGFQISISMCCKLYGEKSINHILWWSVLKYRPPIEPKPNEKFANDRRTTSTVPVQRPCVGYEIWNKSSIFSDNAREQVLVCLKTKLFNRFWNGGTAWKDFYYYFGFLLRIKRLATEPTQEHLLINEKYTLTRIHIYIQHHIYIYIYICKNCKTLVSLKQ